jgi:hypothetical protein
MDTALPPPRPLSPTGGGGTPSPAVCCRHCRAGRVRWRGLCRACYELPDVRALYPSAGPCSPRGVASSDPGRRPAAPTAAPPWSPAKVDVLAARAEAGEGLWHPDDAPPAWRSAQE